jgi:hypothetical protein
MNWARGLFRLWVVAASLWLGSVAWLARDALCPATAADRRVEAAVAAGPLVLAKLDETLLEETARTLADCLPRQGFFRTWWRAREPVLVVLLGPPIAALLLGCALVWVGRGFRRDRFPENREFYWRTEPSSRPKTPES